MRSNLIRLCLATVMAASLLPAGKLLAADANTIRYGIDDEQNINRLPQFIAEKKGFFTREGVKVELVRFKSAFRTGPAQANAANQQTMRQGMTSGAIDMARQQLPLLIHDDLAGANYVGVAVTSDNPVYFLVGQPGINSIADFKGKTVAITNLYDGITIWSQKLIANHGLKTADVTWKSIAGSNARIRCLTSGECAAVTLDQPAIFEGLAAHGYVFGLTNDIGPQLYQVDIAKPDWAASHRELVGKYIRATTAAMRYIMDPKNRYDTVDAVKELTGQPEAQSREMLAYIWDPKNRVFQTSAPNMDNVKAVIALLADYGAVKQPLPAPERFVDPGFARDAGVSPNAPRE